eukprot:TRINITY_DN6242_c0_g1_i1.p2 TRINITY_DN6242_c0_g1~~TRINITY_DN6242_c0_g1_i1.p2  ORF type:complete len:210 (+),score=17.28 TRINITY_DN6242_c0_g1_i1:74-703(+)
MYTQPTVPKVSRQLFYSSRPIQQVVRSPLKNQRSLQVFSALTKEGLPTVYPRMQPPQLSEQLKQYLKLLAMSYEREMGTKLVDNYHDINVLSEELWYLECGILSHDVTAEPYLYLFANQAALKAFGGEWDDIVGKPSKFCVGAHGQDKRNMFLQEAFENGHAIGFDLSREYFVGHKILIKKCVLFNVKNTDGQIIGQAAVNSGIATVKH